MRDRTRFPVETLRNRETGAVPVQDPAQLMQPELGTVLQEGAISNQQVQASGLDAAQLTMADQANLIPDPGFESLATHRLLQGGWEATSFTGQEGSYCVTVVSNGTRRRHVVRRVTCDPNDKFLLKWLARVQTGASAGVGTNPAFGVTWLDDAQASLSEARVEEGTYDQTWRTRQGMVQAPASTRYADFWIETPATMTTGLQVWADLLYARQQLAFASALSGARVELDLNGLRAYNAGGTQTFNLDAATGNATFAGTIEVADFSSSTLVNLSPNNGLRWLSSDINRYVTGIIYSDIVDLGGGFDFTKYLYAASANSDVSKGSTLRRSELELSTTYTADLANVATARLRGSSGAGKHAYVEISERTGWVAGGQSFVRLYKGSNSDAGFWLDLDPVSSDQGNSRYAAGMKGSTWQNSSTSNNAGAADYTDGTEKTLLTVTITAVKGRRYQVSGMARAYVGVSGITAGTTIVARLYDDTSSTLLQDTHTVFERAANYTSNGFHLETEWVAAASGSRTFSLRVIRALGAGTWRVNATATSAMRIRVEDVGY